MDPTLERRLRLGLTAALALYGLALLRHPEARGLIDGVDLAIHETGHLVFAPFGEFMTFLGGTAFQLIMPAADAVHFLGVALYVLWIWYGWMAATGISKDPER